MEGDLITLGSQNDLNEFSAVPGEKRVRFCACEEDSMQAEASSINAGNCNQTTILQSPTPNRSAVATQLKPLQASLSTSAADLANIKLPTKNFDSVSGSLLLCPTRKEARSVEHRCGVSFRWQRGEAIGRGGFGTVYLGLNLDTGELMAVKQLDTKDVSARELQDIENELSLLACTTQTAEEKEGAQNNGQDYTDNKIH